MDTLSGKVTSLILYQMFEQLEMQSEESNGIVERELLCDYNSNHSFSLLLSKSNFFLYDSSDGGSRTV
jgi:hypothetical protein